MRVRACFHRPKWSRAEQLLLDLSQLASTPSRSVIELQNYGIPAGVKLAQPELPIALTDHIWEKRLVLYSRRHTLAAARTLTPLSPDPESCTNG